MHEILLFASIAALALALPLLLYILVAEKTLNLQRVWSLAVQGNRAARVYIVLIGLAFVLGVAATILSLIQQPKGRSRDSSSPKTPNPSVNATSNGMAPGPRSTAAYHVLRGPGTMPSDARYLKR